MEERVKIMNMKWMSLVAVMTVFSAGCSESEQESGNKVASDVAVPDKVASDVVVLDKVASDVVVPDKVVPKGVQFDETRYVEVKMGDKPVITPEQKSILNSVEGIPPEKLDAEVKGLVAKISENSDMSKEEATKLEQDLKSVFQRIEADRAQ